MNGNSSFVWIIVALCVLATGVLSMFLNFGINFMIDVHNTNVDAGLTTESTEKYIGYGLAFFKILWIFAIIGLLVWAKVNINILNSLTDAQLIVYSLFGMYISCFTTVLSIFIYGSFIDILIGVVASGLGVFEPSELFTSFGFVSFFINVGYVIWFIEFAIGVTVFCLACVNKTFGEFLSGGFGTTPQPQSDDEYVYFGGD